MSREGNQMIFSKEEQTTVSFWCFFPERKEKLENISLKFLSCNHSHPSNWQPNTIVSENWLITLKGNSTSIFGFHCLLAFQSYPTYW